MSVRQNGAVIAGGGTKNMLTQKNITNCITNIPQDIKLELSGGVLTLKAGSKVYIPNGVGVFDTVTIASDIVRTSGGDGTGKNLFYKNGTIASRETVGIASGSTPPSSSLGNYLGWYDTTNNVIKLTSDGGSTWDSGWSFPFCIIHDASGAVFLDQTFNGFGYIGSTVFALPGVKGLIPNGRNADGTLKNTITNDFNTVKTVQVNTSTAKIAMYSGGSLGSQTKNLGLNEPENYNYDNGVLTNALEVASVIVNSSAKITAFTPKTAFHAVDYNDTEYMAHQAMPSGTYTNLTLGASGASYTAPADGYVTLIKAATGVRQYIEMSTGQLFANMAAIYSGQLLYATIPVSKGASFTIYYNAGGSTNRFVCTYANGAQ